LLLELSHAVEPAQAGDAVEDPGKLGVLGNLALIENYVFGRIDAAGDESGGHFAPVLRQFLGAAPDGWRLRGSVQVDDAVDALILVLERDKLCDGAEVVTQMKIAGRLDAGKHSFLEGHAETSPIALPDGTTAGAGASPTLGRRHGCVRTADRCA